MAAAKKKPAPKAQRVSKAKGLHEDVGKYKDKKSLNLRDKQLGKKGVAAAKKRTVSISKTQHEKTGKHKGLVTGPAGNPLTGKVDMGGGNMAVYKDGKRVTAKAKKTTPPKKTPPKSTPLKPLTAAQKAALLKDKSNGQGKSKSSIKGSGSSAGEKKPIKGSGSSAGKKPEEGNKSGTKTGTGKKWYEQGGGGLAGPNSPIKGPQRPKEGSTYIGRNGNKYVYKSGKWMPTAS